MAGSNREERRFSKDDFDELKGQEQSGWLTTRVLPQSNLTAVGRMGAVTVTVTLTPLFKDLADKVQPRAGWVRLTTLDPEIVSVVQDTAFKSPLLPANDQFRLVLGTFQQVLTPAAAKLRPSSAKLQEPMRFRAIFKYDPFNKAYQFVRADRGFSSGHWLSNSSPPPPKGPWPY
jgi:hypothetical protein